MIAAIDMLFSHRTAIVHESHDKIEALIHNQSSCNSNLIIILFCEYRGVNDYLILKLKSQALNIILLCEYRGVNKLLIIK